MLCAGFIGTNRHRRRFSQDETSFSVVLTGLSGGMAQNGAVLGYTQTSAGEPTAQRWQTSPDMLAWSDIPGGSAASETIDLAGPRHSDMQYIRVGVEIDAVEQFSNIAPMVYAPPATVGVLDDQTLFAGTGVQLYDASGAFAGANISFGIVAPEGVTIDPLTGVISFESDILPPQTGTPVTVTATNSGGTATAGLAVSVTQSNLMVVQRGQEAVVVTATEGTVSVTIAQGTYAGTYTSDHAGNPLTVADITAQPLCLSKPVVTGGTAQNDTLTITPGLWIFDGDDRGDQSWQHQRNGVDIPAATDLTYLIQPADSGAVFTTVETYGAHSVTSQPLTLDVAPFSPAFLPDVFIWLPLADPFNIYTDAALTVPVSNDGDVVRGLRDASGNNNHFINSGASNIYDATRGELQFDGTTAADTRYVHVDGKPANPPASMDVYICLNTSDNEATLLSFTGGSAMVIADDTFTSNSGFTTGNVVYYTINGVPLTGVGSSTNRKELRDVVSNIDNPVGSVLVCVRNLYDTTRDNWRLFASSGNGSYRFTGAATHVVYVDSTISAADRSLLETYLLARRPN